MTDHKDEAKKAANKDGSVDKAKGHTNEVVGKVKEKVGSALGSDKMEAKGAAQNAEGKGQKAKGEVKEALHDTATKVKAGAEAVGDKIKEAVHKK